MAEFRRIFPGAHTFLAVIHAENLSQVLCNVKIAHDEGADGVFLISHGVLPALQLIWIYQSVRGLYPSWWIGLNFLDRLTYEALRIVPENASGLWVDDGGIIEGIQDPSKLARLYWKQREEYIDWKGLYFGGVAFKYRKPVYDLARVAGLAVPFMDVITTSGDATGQPPTVKKMQTMRDGIGYHPLAIASGITAENVGKYFGIADCFLVATSISKSFTELDPVRVRQLAQVIAAA